MLGGIRGRKRNHKTIGRAFIHKTPEIFVLSEKPVKTSEDKYVFNFSAFDFLPEFIKFIFNIFCIYIFNFID